MSDRVSGAGKGSVQPMQVFRDKIRSPERKEEDFSGNRRLELASA